MQTTMKRIVAVCSMAIMFVFMAGMIALPAFAAEVGIYTADAAAHYKHPEDGTIEDAGGESASVLGQSMTESATHNRALVEVDAQGNTYVTVRLKLTDNLEKIRFAIDGKDVPAVCTQEDNFSSTADYRMKVSSAEDIIRVSMYVTAMGRDVIFYVTLSNLQFGYEDFVATIDAPFEGKMPQQQTEGFQKQQEEPAVKTSDKHENSGKNDVIGIAEYDDAGQLVGAEQEGSAGELPMGMIFTVLAAIAAAGAIGFSIWYFCFFRKK